MKAFSIKQPWANMIMRGRKHIEIRHWRHPYRGKLFIHASKRHDPQGKALFPEEPITPLGAVLGTVELKAITQYNTYQEWYEDYLDHLNPYDWYEKGLFGWVFEDPQLLPAPVRLKGKTGIFIIKVKEELVTF